MKKLLIAGSVALAAVLTCSLTVQSPQAATKAKAVKIKSVTAKKNTKVTVKYKKQKKASGYQIKFSTSKSFKKSKTITKTVGKKKISCSTKRFSAGDTVYVKVRSYKIVNGKKKYGRWSVIKKATVPADLNDSGSSANQSDDSTASDTTDSGNAEDSSADLSDDSTVGDSTDSGSVEDSSANQSDDSTTDDSTDSGSAEDSSANQSDDSTTDDSTDSGSADDSTASSGSSSDSSSEDSSNAVWTYDGTTLTISGTGATGSISTSKRSSVEHIIIEDGITEISDFAFSFCENLRSIEIADSVTSIGMWAFVSCCSLEEIKLPAGITEIEPYTFNCCTSLTEIVIPENVKSIGEEAFGHCTSLTSVTLPDGLESIEQYAFCGCTSLTSINIPENCSVHEDAFAESEATVEGRPVSY